MIERVRQARIRRAYRTIGTLEGKVKDKAAAASLRTNFAQDTVRIIDAMWKQGHIKRPARRQAKRALVR